MPSSHVIYPDRNLVIVTLSGRVTLAEVLTDAMVYAADPRFHKGQNTFIDASQATDYRITFQGLIALVKFLLGPLDPFDATTLTSIYAPSDKLFDKAKQYQRLTSSSGTQCIGVFREKAAAWAFLGIEEPGAQEVTS